MECAREKPQHLPQQFGGVQRHVLVEFAAHQ